MQQKLLPAVLFLATFLLLPCGARAQEGTRPSDAAATAGSPAPAAEGEVPESTENAAPSARPAEVSAATDAAPATPAAEETTVVTSPAPVIAPLERPEEQTFVLRPPPPAPKAVPLKPGPHFGLGARILALGALRAKEKSSDEYAHSNMANTAGLELYFEYMTEGQMVAPGVGVRVDFPVWEEEGYEAYPLGVEIEVDYRMRIYLARASLLRPYLQGAFGLSLGAANSLVKEDYPLAVGFNGSGSAGLAVAPRNSLAAFFIDVGLQGTMFWIPAKNESTTTSNYGYYYSYASGDETVNGAIRYLVVSIGLEI